MDERYWLEQVFKRWSPEQLLEWATLRRGFACSDIGCGLRYPELYDEADEAIPPGFVEVHHGWDAVEFQIPETQYLEILRGYLRTEGHLEVADRVDGLPL